MTLSNHSIQSINSVMSSGNNSEQNHNNDNDTRSLASNNHTFDVVSVVNIEEEEDVVSQQDNETHPQCAPTTASPWVRVILKQMLACQSLFLVVNVVVGFALSILLLNLLGWINNNHNHHNDSLAVSFRGTSSGSGCHEYYNDTTGLLDRVRLSGSQDTATWKFLNHKNVVANLEFVVVSMKYCQLDQRTPSSFQVSLLSTAASGAGPKPLAAKLIETRFDESKCQRSSNCDCSNLDHYQAVEFGLTMSSSGEDDSADTAFPYDAIQLSPYLLEQPELHFRDFAVRKYN